ncbi:hypothetical protein Tco_1145726 [Tanacetum coccineum]
MAKFHSSLHFASTSLRFAQDFHCVLLEDHIADALGTTPEGGILLGPERPRTYEDLSDTEKKRYDADVRATNIVLQGLPKDIYKLINHNIEAKAIWDNVKMLLAGSELTKEDRESQLYDEFERFKMLLDRLIIEIITPATNDQLAFVSTVQPHAQSSHVQSHQYPSSSTNPQSPPPPPPPSNTQGGQSTSTATLSSLKTVASAEYTAWTMTDTTIKLSISPIPEELHMGDDSTADEQAYSSSGEDVGRDHIPTVNLRQSWWKPITEDRPATPEPAWSIPSSDLTVPTNN